MNATGKIGLGGLLVLTCVLHVEPAAAGSGIVLPWAATALVSQVNGEEASPPSLTKEQVEALLARAKQAIAGGRLDVADRLIVEAESAAISYPMFYSGDTPARLRRVVDQAKRDQARMAPRPAPSAVRPPNPFQRDTQAKPRALPAVGQESSPQMADDPKAQTLQLMAASRAAMKQGNLPQAERYAVQAGQMNVPEAEFATSGDSPARLAWDLQKARYQANAPVAQAAAMEPVGAPRYGSQAVYVPEQDVTSNQPVNSLVGPAGGPRLAQASRYGEPQPLNRDSATPSAAELLSQGEQALRSGDLTAAWRLFQQANARRPELDAVSQARIDTHLKMLANAPTEPAAVPAPFAGPINNAGPAELAPPPARLDDTTTGSSLFDSADAAQRVLVRQLSTDVGKKTLESREIRAQEPRRALEILKTMRMEVENSQLADQYRRQLLRRVDVAIADTEKYISDNRAQIELDEKNAAVLAEVERASATRLKLQEKKAAMVDQFNRLRDEQRYAEAELIAKQLYEMMPDDEVAILVWQNAKFLRREVMNRQMRLEKEGKTYKAGWLDPQTASIPTVSDGEEVHYSPKTWPEAARRTSLSGRSNRLTERELQIQQKLKTPVQMQYQDQPLSKVIDQLSQMTGVNIHLDPRGLSQEGVSSDTPVSLDLNREVMLKSALNLILEPLRLSYVIKDEVLKITSEQLRDGEIYPQTYYVADLVTPIPNFVPSNNIGLQGLINDAHAALGYGNSGFGAPGPTAMVAGRRPGMPGESDPAMLANQVSGPQFNGSGATLPLGGGGPSPGGGANADFESLIDLIISTVASETWAENGGGEAEIRRYVNNLSLVVSQTQAVHEEIADLLEQLRRLQDLQITIEVRFIRLNDSFFERIGIDFDVNINDNTVGTDDLAAGGGFETPRGSQTVGVVQQVAGDLPVFSSDLDVPFRQGSFGVAVPQFGGFDPGQAASFGFAILSDIEAYFLINAAQGDQRTNVLNAPKVTLFNGQTAFVADASQRPFVISVIPVVGEFAAAQQPVIVVLSEGTMMNIQAVVSDDRRYVRLTVVPFFSEIGDVDTFTFEGETTTGTSSSSTDADDDGTNEEDSASENVVRSGTTVQLPTFQFVSVSTTVSVPDGGTVLLGGIKRLNEGRSEFGVPLLSKLPYINRLFRNVGIGRETDSLMMMVTPRIIIQEEEEQKLGFSGS